MPSDTRTTAKASGSEGDNRGESATQIVEVKVPDIGDFDKVAVIEVLVSPGDKIEKETSLITLESDKATMEVPSPLAGTVADVMVAVNDQVAEGTPILKLEVQQGNETAPHIESAPAAEKSSSQQPATTAPRAETTPPREHPRETPGAGERRPPTAALEASTRAQPLPHASPSVRRFARELGVELREVAASGPKGRILKEDVQAHVKRAMTTGAGFNLPALPTVDFARFGAVEVRPLTRIQRISGPNLHRNWLSIPHVTQFDEADITELEQFRKENQSIAAEQGFRLTLTALLIAASVAALKRFPQINASLSADGDSLVIKKYYHIGVAVDTEQGLVVPVLREADKKGIFDLARELGEISERARNQQLTKEDMQGGSFTISSLGGLGGTAFTPIINGPEVAILGVSRAQLRPMYRNNELVPRLMLPFSLSYDHRVVDGADAVRFTAALGALLGDIRRILL